MILKIAWRNVWRNRLRSGVVIFAIMIGIWAGIFMSSMSIGMTETRTEDALEHYISHIQIHNPEYTADRKVRFSIPNIAETEATLNNNDSVIQFCKRTIYAEGILASAKGNRNVQIVGIDPEKERLVTAIHNCMVDGNYFEEFKGKPVCIGKKIADKYNYQIGEKLILQFQDKNGNIHAVKFKVCGIFQSVNLQHDELTVYVPHSTLEKEVGFAEYHEIALNTFDKQSALGLSTSLQKDLPELSVEYWGQVSPEMGYTDEMMDVAMYLYMGIIMLALLFGIINTMLMAVLERKRELGMLMAVGMTKPKVFLMIVVETLFLALVGGPLGIFIGHLTVQYFGTHGIDLAVVAEGMSSFGMSSMLYTKIDPSAYIDIAIMVICTALIAAIYPARKALKLNPSESIRAL